MANILKQKIWNLVVSNPEKNNCRLRAATENKLQISRMKKYSFFADTKLEVEQIKKKIEKKLIKPLFIWKSIIFKGRNDHKLSSKNLNALAWSSLESQIDLPLLRFDLICSVPFYWKKRLF